MKSLDENMTKTIEIVPALKRVHLKHIGCWNSLCMEFQPALNIITDDGTGLGRSTIFRAILQAVHPSPRPRFPLWPTKGFHDGEIFVEFMSRSVKQRITNPPVVPSVATGDESLGKCRLKLLRSCIETAQTETALLLESEAFDCLDEKSLSEIFKMLNAPPCQIICIMSRHLKPEQFSNARIFSCFWQEEKNRAGIRLQQNGRVALDSPKS